MNTNKFKIIYKIVQPKSEALPPIIRKLGALLLPDVSCDGSEGITFIFSPINTLYFR